MDRSLNAVQQPWRSQDSLPFFWPWWSNYVVVSSAVCSRQSTFNREEGFLGGCCFAIIFLIWYHNIKKYIKKHKERHELWGLVMFAGWVRTVNSRVLSKYSAQCGAPVTISQKCLWDKQLCSHVPEQQRKKVKNCRGQADHTDHSFLPKAFSAFTSTAIRCAIKIYVRVLKGEKEKVAEFCA